jgi:nitrogen fixation/metabolism regulation signal transduction histidine kinase
LKELDPVNPTVQSYVTVHVVPLTFTDEEELLLLLPLLLTLHEVKEVNAVDKKAVAATEKQMPIINKFNLIYILPNIFIITFSLMIFNVSNPPRKPLKLSAWNLVYHLH